MLVGRAFHAFPIEKNTCMSDEAGDSIEKCIFCRFKIQMNQIDQEVESKEKAVLYSFPVV